MLQPRGSAAVPTVPLPNIGIFTAGGAESQEEFTVRVERILMSDNVRGAGSATLYQVRWKGYGSEHDSWEPPECFAGTGFIENFEKRLASDTLGHV